MTLIDSIMVIHIQHVSLLKDKLMVEKRQLNAAVVQASAVTRWWRCIPERNSRSSSPPNQSAVFMAPSCCGLQLPLSSWASVEDRQEPQWDISRSRYISFSHSLFQRGSRTEVDHLLQDTLSLHLRGSEGYGRQTH